jgi:hypothetical protein
VVIHLREHQAHLRFKLVLGALQPSGDFILGRLLDLRGSAESSDDTLEDRKRSLEQLANNGRLAVAG